jgi:hypothetical protein
MPSVRLILVLRNPVDRLWAAAIMHLVSGPKRKFTDVSESEFFKVMSKKDNLERGFYPNILKNWRSAFPKEQMLILFYDDLVENPQTFLQCCFEFIGVSAVDSWSRFPLHVRFNKTPDFTMPEKFREHIFNIYKPSVLTLSKEFGDKIKPWLKYPE